MTKLSDDGATRPLLMTPAQAAREMAISRTTLYHLLSHKQIRSLKIGSATRIPLTEVESWIQRQLASGGAGIPC